MTLYELDFYLSVSFFGKEFIGKKRVSVCQEIKDSSLFVPRRGTGYFLLFGSQGIPEPN